MKKQVLFGFLMLVLFLALSPAAYAQAAVPEGTCPTGYALHSYEMHEGIHQNHIGLAEDLNQNGWICVLHLSNGKHVHVDDVVMP